MYFECDFLGKGGGIKKISHFQRGGSIFLGEAVGGDRKSIHAASSHPASPPLPVINDHSLNFVKINKIFL